MEPTEMPSQPVRILVVDDDPTVIHAMPRLLKSAGYDTRVAVTGQDCLNRLQETLPDLILLDVALPDMDGLEICRRIKADPNLADTFVVLLSRNKTDSDKQAEGLEAGADGYIARPVGNRELLARVQALLRLRAAEARVRLTTEALRQSEKKFRALAETIQDVFWIATPEINKTIYVSPAYETLWGRSCESLYDSPRSFIDAIHPEDRDRVVDVLNQHRGQGTPWSVIYRIIRPDGSLRWIADRGFPIRDDRGNLYMNTGVATDITAQKKAEEDNLQQNEQLRHLTARLAEVQEIERQNLARELHDQVCQNLTTLSLILEAMKIKARQEPVEQLLSRISRASDLVAHTAGIAKDMMEDLRPTVLDHYGLLGGLRWWAEQFSRRTGINVAVQGKEAAPRLASPVELALFRIAQEALTNVARHAGASRVVLTEEVDADTVRLAITDNGNGFDPHPLGQVKDRPRWGLMTMSERAAAVGARFSIDSQPGQGTRVEVEVSR
jgi:PAS domain S-box-containing protein